MTPQLLVLIMVLVALYFLQDRGIEVKDESQDNWMKK